MVLLQGLHRIASKCWLNSSPVFVHSALQLVGGVVIASIAHTATHQVGFGWLKTSAKAELTLLVCLGIRAGVDSEAWQSGVQPCMFLSVCTLGAWQTCWSHWDCAAATDMVRPTETAEIRLGISALC